MRKKTIGAAIILATIALFSYGQSKANRSIGVKTIKVEQGALYATVHATGKVKSVREACLSASASGQIVGVFVREGQSVAKGHVLIQLDAREAEAGIAKAEAQLRECREKADQAKRTKDGLEQVWKVGGTSLQTLKDAESALLIAIAALEKAESELHSARLSLAHLKIMAPFAGLITKNSARLGEWAAPGTALITLSDERTREIEVLVDDADAGNIAPGQNVDITSDAFPERIRVERTVRVDPAVQKEGTANTITVHVSLGADERELRLGQQVDARIRTASRENAFKLPFEALISQDGKTFVAVMNESKAHLVPVNPGLENATHVEITEGVQAGQEVILTEGRRLREGQHVHKIRDARAL